MSEFKQSGADDRFSSGPLCYMVRKKRSSLLPQKRCDQAGGLGAWHDDAVAGEELVVRECVAAFLDGAPVDPHDLVAAANGMGADEIAFSGRLFDLRPA